MNSLEALKNSYDIFLRSPQFTYIDSINNAIDDYARKVQNKSSTLSGGVGTGCPRVRVKLSELRRVEGGMLERGLVNDPMRHLRALEFAAHDIGKEERPGYDDKYGKCWLDV